MPNKQQQDGKEQSGIRFWRNETGCAHRVIDFEESNKPNFDFKIKTACGLEYHTQSSGFIYHPEIPAWDRTHSLTEDERCMNCSWETSTDG